MYKLLILVMWVSGLIVPPLSPAQAHAGELPDTELSVALSFWSSGGEPVTLQDILSPPVQRAFQPVEHDVLALGIGAPVTWVRLALHNDRSKPVQRVLVIGVSWLDSVRGYLMSDSPVQQTALLGYAEAGDGQPFNPQRVKPPDLVLPFEIPPGDSTLYLEVSTQDPMTLPLTLLTPEAASIRQQANHYTYGALYGFLFAMLAFSLVLYAGVMDRYHLLYAAYMGAFALMNMAYTGHGSMWIWPTSPQWQQWSLPWLLLGLTGSGLLLGLNFLEARRIAPRLFSLTLAGLGGAVLLMLGLHQADEPGWALRLAGLTAIAYGISMLVLSARALRQQLPHARYFLAAILFGALGALITALAVWGLLPLNRLTFRAVELGMMLQALLLVIAVSARIWDIRTRHDQAQLLAQLDPLTSLYNRRAFYRQSAPRADSHAQMRRYAIVMIDIDHFKQFNDQWGHQLGDQVLVNVGQALQAAIRQADVAARWGGEEFILFLRNSDLHHASHLADRLQAAIGQLRIPHEGQALQITVSMGIAQGHHDNQDMDTTIARADKALYEAKANGRNQVMIAA